MGRFFIARILKTLLLNFIGKNLFVSKLKLATRLNFVPGNEVIKNLLVVEADADAQQTHFLTNTYRSILDIKMSNLTGIKIS